MSIIYYPNRTFKRGDRVPAIDRIMAKKIPQTIRGTANIASNSLSQVISYDYDWQVDSISFLISNAASKDFGYAVMNGIRVVTNYNDALWFWVTTTNPQRIVLTDGFYTGTQLATQLRTQLNANTTYIATGITFTVTYNNTTGLFVITPITPAGQTIKYMQKNNNAGTNNYIDSIAGNLFGLTTDGAYAANVTSDTVVVGLDDEVNVVYNLASTLSSYYSDTTHPLSMDQALHLKSSNGVSSTIDWQVVTEQIV